ncbi:DUF6787 family protein [Aquimarina muelleri]|uniref:DUF6787 domain-containing protein n=1 Tax=Aquimarina muelleri TaxID=279356 RepID=A0A918N2H4_9FLAO|nr:DUF6787 family protein [Aquimarina muelleri]MCX2762085.1 prolipoprotein diacylglyceryl transferase [Aquimarina muelleri]GGX04343.1 hypothetical protein GCM10007384_02670 [Aquimarina muelleri]
MQKFKDRWEIKRNWQLIFPILGILSLIFSSYLIAKYILNLINIQQTDVSYFGVLSAIIIIISFIFLFITLRLFNILEPRWKVNYRWELIAIFIAFAITGSTAARISDPILSFLSLDRSSTNAWIYWPIRILIVFPIYQILLLIVGWIFGQFKFFWSFEKKMLNRMGLARFF